MHHGELLNKSIKTVTGTKVATAGTGVNMSGTVFDVLGTIVNVSGTVYQYLAKKQHKTATKLQT